MLRFALAGAVLLTSACMTPTAPGPAGANLGLQPAPDTCNAARYANLLGRPYTEAPAAGSMPFYRLFAQGDPVTLDLSEQRLNIIYNRATGRIVGIRCF